MEKYDGWNPVYIGEIFIRGFRSKKHQFDFRNNRCGMVRGGLLLLLGSVLYFSLLLIDCHGIYTVDLLFCFTGVAAEKKNRKPFFFLRFCFEERTTFLHGNAIVS